MSDVLYLLGTYDAFDLCRTTRDRTPRDRDLSDRLQDVLIACARTGVPAADGGAFVRYDPRAERRTGIGEAMATQPLNGAGLDFLLAPPAPQPGAGGPPPVPGKAPPLPQSPRY